MERLPVNPRRHKIPPEARKRVSQACNSCNVRRAKCSGGQPCDRCRKSSRECRYPVADEMISVSRKQRDALAAKCALLEQALAEAIPSDRERAKLLEHLQSDVDVHGRDLEEVDQEIAEDGQNIREGRILQDPDGTVRYLGESSGATFLNHLREYMATVFPLTFDTTWPGASNPDTAFISALGRYQTHDSRPLLTSNIDPLTLPTKEEAITMLTELRYSAQDGDGTFPSGGIYYWLDPQSLMSEYQAYFDADGTTDVNPQMVTANAAFAVACQFNPDCAPDWESASGQTFFARAKAFLGNPLDISVVNDASVLALLSFYLLNNNRRDAAYIYVSVAMHIMIVHGVHRAWMVDEPGKRLFWTVYVLDRWLSCLMGRPALIADEAIKLDLPRDASGLPPAAGLRAHVELVRISNYIVSNVYDISRQRDAPVKTTLCIHKAIGYLQSWHESLRPVVECTEENLKIDRGVGELHMAHNQLIILAIRPLLFIAVKKVTANMLLNGRADNHEISYQVELDLSANAARRNVHLWHSLLRLPRPARLSHSSIHYLFNAALTLQLYQILAESQGHGDYEEVSFVISILYADQGTNKEYAKDCANVLTDLSSLMGRLRRVDLSKASARGDMNRVNGLSLHLSTAAVSSPSGSVGNTSVSGSLHHQFSRSQDAADELNPSNATTSPFDPRETAYNELLSWLQTDELQQKFDFPHRLG